MSWEERKCFFGFYFLGFFTPKFDRTVRKQQEMSWRDRWGRVRNWPQVWIEPMVSRFTVWDGHHSANKELQIYNQVKPKSHLASTVDLTVVCLFRKVGGAVVKWQHCPSHCMVQMPSGTLGFESEGHSSSSLSPNCFLTLSLIKDQKHKECLPDNVEHNKETSHRLHSNGQRTAWTSFYLDFRV